MGRILGLPDVEAAIRGGSVFAAGGGGWADHGRMLGTAAVTIGHPELVSMEEVPDDAFIATAAAIGAPAGTTEWQMLGVDYVKAVELMDTPGRKVMAGEVLPNLMSVVMVELGLRFTYSILIIAGLSFLGFGIQPPAANWGLMINENRIGLVVNPWAVIVPAGLIALLTIGLNTFTDAIARASLGVDRPAEEMVMATGIILDRSA